MLGLDGAELMFLQEIDAAWKPAHPGKQVLHIIGCGALLLQTNYQRGTKDSDILEAADLDAATKTNLLALAGRNTTLHARHRMFLEIVGQGAEVFDDACPDRAAAALTENLPWRLRRDACVAFDGLAHARQRANRFPGDI